MECKTPLTFSQGCFILQKVKFALHVVKGEKMKQQNILYFLITSIGMGAAMSVALQDVAVGMAVGVGVAIAFTYGDRASCNLKKSRETESK
jgi:hypothetical protein